MGRPGGGRTRYKAPVAIHLGDEEEIYERGIWNWKTCSFVDGGGEVTQACKAKAWEEIRSMGV